MGGFQATIVERIEKFGALHESAKELIRSAIVVRKFAYAPYSNFKVGAAFRTTCGNIYTGCNVENAAYTPTSCAERTAICKAVSEGLLHFTEGAVVAYQDEAFTTPCGVCRQFIMEFSPDDIPIYITKGAEDADVAIEKNDSDEVLCTSIYNLLPNGFQTYRSK